MPPLVTRAGLCRLGIRLLILIVVLTVVACQRVSAPSPKTDPGPVAVLRALTSALRRNDLVGYAKTTVTPRQYAQLEIAWRTGRSRWPLTDLPFAADVPALLSALSAPQAEQRLQQAFERQLAGQGNGIRQAAQSLGQFGVQYLRNRSEYRAEQRDQYIQMVTALSQWASAAPLADRQRARTAIAELVAAARKTEISSQTDLQRLGMEQSLRRLEPFLVALKHVFARYGLVLDDSLDGLRARLIDQRGEQAQVWVHYPLAEQQIQFTVGLVKREDRWYLQQTQAQVQALLTLSADPAPTPGPSDVQRPGR